MCDMGNKYEKEKKINKMNERIHYKFFG